MDTGTRTGKGDRGDRRYEVISEILEARQTAQLEQFVAFVVHEIKQPITATLISAQAARRWLAVNPPNLTEAQEALSNIVRAAMRSDEIANRVHKLATRRRKRLLRSRRLGQSRRKGPGSKPG
ncbi:histidine kinase dimerization/phospho-acceptor domain-containing protein [Paraburkholderia sp. 2C]|jgi:signal transduction histidine kinase